MTSNVNSKLSLSQRREAPCEGTDSVGILHPGKESISQVWSSSIIAGAWLYMGGHLTDLKIWRTVMKRAVMIGRI